MIPHVTTDSNLVVSFGTAVGKSAIAELAIKKALQDGKKTIYIAPLKALLEEKASDWSEDRQLNTPCVIRSKDHHPSESEYNAAGIILTTIEGFAFISRSEASWLKDVGLIVVDEAHFIGEKSRGSTLEGSLMLFCARFNSRLVMLSATMSNAGDISKWAKAINGRKSLCFSSLWRPNQVEINFHYVDGWILDDVVKEVMKSDAKTIVFVQSKKFGKELLKAIRLKGKRCSFHNASVKKGLRKRIEEAFGDLDSGLDVIIATSTLNTGTNL